MQDTKVYTKDEVRSLHRGPSLYPPVIVRFLTGPKMLFHDKQGGSIYVNDDVDAEDSLSIWVRSELRQNKIDTKTQFIIAGSSSSSYTASFLNQQWSCTCAGFGFRRRCRHIEEAKQKHSNQIKQI